MGPLLPPVSSRAVCDHVRWWFTFQTTKNPFAAGQKVPASSSGSPRAQTSPSAKTGGARRNRFQKGLQATAAEEEGAKEGTAAEGPQEGPKEEGRRDPGAGIFP